MSFAILNLYLWLPSKILKVFGGCFTVCNSQVLVLKDRNNIVKSRWAKVISGQLIDKIIVNNYNAKDLTMNFISPSHVLGRDKG